ncbi:hypothetical protein ACWEV9_29570 [Streptomyces albogriseolus]
MSVEPYGADEESAAVLRTVGRVIKMCRERAGLTQAVLGVVVKCHAHISRAARVTAAW